MMIRGAARAAAVVGASILVLTLAACGAKQPPVARPTPPPPPAPAQAPAVTPPAPPEPVAEQPPIVPPEPMQESSLGSASLDTLNRTSPLKDVFFDFDSTQISSDGQAALQQDATLLKQYPTWKITIEGHCDERGTAEYNLALGERRAAGVQAYLVSLGIPADRMRIVSYGKEFPFDPGHDEAAWAKNRRAHFVITSK